MFQYNLEYPDFYTKLYALFTVEVLFVKYKVGVTGNIICIIIIDGMRRILRGGGGVGGNRHRRASVVDPDLYSSYGSESTHGNIG